MSQSDREIVGELKNSGIKIYREIYDDKGNLILLDLRMSQLSKLPLEVTQLTNLIELVLSRNNLSHLPAEITQLTNLSELYLADNNFSQFPLEVTQLANLTELDVSYNNISQLPAEIAKLTRLTRLYLDSIQFNHFPPEITELNNLLYLDLSHNNLSQFPLEVTQLANLTELILSHNNISQLPAEIAKLTKLTKLNVSYNDLSQLPREITQLKNLSYVDFYKNPIEKPPVEVISQGIKAIGRYFEQLGQEGMDRLYEAKLLIVGEPGAGKTSLAKKIIDESYDLQFNEKTTEGIDVIQWQFQMPDGNSFRANIWDFGGQEIYHATHQFFLTKRSLYLLVADSRKEDTDFYYWLNVVELLSDNSPIFIIKNEKQDRHCDINERQLRGRFDNLKMTLATNLATNRGLQEIIDEIRHYIVRLPHAGDELPQTWVNVRRALETDPRNYISLDEYFKICQDNGFTKLENKLQLSGYLHDLGVILHFQDDDLLNKIVILKPEWGTAAVYKALDNALVIKNRGRFDRADLAQIWYEPQYITMRAELLRLMIRFRLCYQIPDTTEYIAPQLLSENQPIYDWNENDNLKLRYSYKFLPKGILTQFIVAMNLYIADQRNVWKNGVILDKVYKELIAEEVKIVYEAQAEVIEYYDDRMIQIRVVGEQKRDFMSVIVHELDKIHLKYPTIQFSKLIPCNCSTCEVLPEPHYYPFDKLREMQRYGKKKVDCFNEPYLPVDIGKLIDDTIGDPNPAELKEVNKYKLRRYQKLKERHALLGIDTPPEVFIEIEDLEEELQSKGLI